MKKIIVIALALMSVVLLCATLSMGAFASENVVYLKDGGTGDGKTAETPFGNIGDAYAALGTEGGTIVVCGSYDFSSAVSNAFFVEPAHTGKVTVTQKYNGVDYRTDGASLYINKGSRWGLNGPLTLENINIEDKTGKTCLLIVCQFNPIVIGEGVENIGFKNTKLGDALSILGGVQNGFDAYNTVTRSSPSNITINSGKFLVAGNSRQVSILEKGVFTGQVNITINGGEITTLYCGSINDGLSTGDVKLTINGGKIKGKVYGDGASPSLNEGNIHVVVTGGDFSGCELIKASSGASNILDVSAYTGTVDVVALAKNFGTVITVDGVVTEPEDTLPGIDGPDTPSDDTTDNTPSDSKETSKPSDETKKPAYTGRGSVTTAAETSAAATTANAADDADSGISTGVIIAIAAAVAVVAAVVVVVIVTTKKKGKAE